MEKTDRRYDLVGRDGAADKFFALARRVQEDKLPLSILVTGAEGSGKTAFVNMCARHLAKADPPFTVVSHASFKAQETPFYPIDQIVLQIANLQSTIAQKTNEEILEIIKRRLREFDIMKNEAEVDQHAAVLLSVITSTGGQGYEPESGMTSAIEKCRYTVRKILGLLADRQAIALFFDDVHRWPADGLETMRALRAGLLTRPVLWVSTAAEGREDLRLLAGEHIELTALTKEETGTFLMESFPDMDPFPDELKDVLHSTSGGMPGVLHQHVGLLIDQRVIEMGADGRWVFVPSRLDPKNLPIDAGAVIELKLKMLDSAERETLKLAAVVGDVFWDDALLALKRAELAGGDPENPAQVWPDDAETLALQGMLEGFMKRGLVTRLESQEFYDVVEYAFGFEGLRERLLQEVSDRRSAALHAATARWLEMVSGHRLGDYAEVIAKHLDAAGDVRGAAFLYLEAADVARSRYLFERAHTLYEKALAGLDENNMASVMHVLHEMGNMAQAMARMDEARRCFTRMLAFAWRSVSRAKAAAALNKIGRIHRQQGDYSAARAFLERSLSLFTQAGDVRGIASTKDDLGNVHYLMGNYETARQLYFDALNIRVKNKDRRGLALSYEHVGQMERAAGNFENAEHHFRQALELRRTIGDEDGAISALNAIGAVAYDKGAHDAAVSIWREALEQAVRVSNLRMMGFLNNNIGEAMMDLGKVTIAETYFKQCLELSTQIADRRAEAEVRKNFGLVYMRTGNVRAARENLNRSIQLAREMGSKEQVGIALRALGQLEGFSIFDEGGGPAGAADSYFQEAVELFRAIGNENEFVHTMEIYAQFLFDHGRVREAIGIVDRAIDDASVHSESVKKRLREAVKKMERFAAAK